jgi:hypothetical protein
MKKTILLNIIYIGYIYASPLTNTDNQKLSASELSKYFKVLQTVATKDGNSLDAVLINGPSKAPLPTPKGFSYNSLFVNSSSSSSSDSSDIESTSSNSINTLLQAPAFNWSFGCAATSGAMIAGYYDRTGYPFVYAGPTNEGKMPLDNSVWPDWTDSNGDTRHQTPLSATHDGLDGRVGRGHVDDYWIAYGNDDDDPYVTDGVDEHSYGDCTADFMKTNQTTNYDNSDGSTVFYFYSSSGDPLTADKMEQYDVNDTDGGYGLKLFFESRGYNVTELYNQKIDTDQEGGFSYAQYKAEIDAKHPVLIHVEGHTMAGIGYNDDNDSNPIVYLHDTWDYDIHEMTWGDSYAGMDHFGVTVIHLAKNIVSGDINQDGLVDLVFRNSESGENLIFFLNQTGTVASHKYTTKLSNAWVAKGTGDFNNDGITDIIFRNNESGENLIYFLNSDGSRKSYAYTTKISSIWDMVGIGDFNGDDISDILFRNIENGKNLISFQNSDGSRKSYAYTTKVSNIWEVVAVADFDNDSIADIFYRNIENGKNFISFQNSDGSRKSAKYTTSISNDWIVGGIGDFDKDGIKDILYRNTQNGKNLISFQNLDGSRKGYYYTNIISTDWNVAMVADFNGDQIADILYRNKDNGKNLISFQNSNGSRKSYTYTTKLNTDWNIVK